MVAWIVICTIWFNFVLGSLIPITPRLNEEMAGVAFSAFAFMKILVFLPAGWISDRIGHYKGFAISLVAQLVTLGGILFFPNWIWLARSMEGITLAFGTISALALLRLYAKDQVHFNKSISLLMGVGSSGFLFGPFFGYQLETQMALTILFVGSVAILILHGLFFRLHEKAIQNCLQTTEGASAVPWALVLCFGLVKGLGVGTEPLLGWWATERIGLSPTMAGLTFVSAAIGFMLGNVRPRLFTAALGLLGLVFIELALAEYRFLWWPGLIFLGLFSGTSINLCLSRLGWNKPENLGSANAKWLAMSDIPMMLTPALLWSIRDQSFWLTRFLGLSGTMLVSLFLLRRRV